MLEPFELAPVLVEKPWGGTRLSELGKYPGRAYFGESWEVADLAPEVAPLVEDPVSRVIGGRWRGWSLGGLASKLGDELMGGVPLGPDGRFPLLVKLIDAREHLSVQVHPTEEYTSRHPGTHLKTESWYVVDADPGSSLFLDVDASSPKDRVMADLAGVTVIPHLRTVPARIGAFHHIPAGMIHALGAGVMVAEVQTPSDTTFRLYDWATEYDRDPREVHTEQAREAVILRHPDAFDLAPMQARTRRELARTPHYWIDEHRLEGGAADLSNRPGFRILMCVAGTADVGRISMTQGSTVVVPACALEVETALDGTLLEVGVPL
jgi:mannose-6-phosphate isomerase